MSKFNNTLLFFVILSVSFLSCMKDKFEINEMGSNKWNPDLAVPLINSSVSMLDITQDVENEDFYIDQNNLVSIIYVDTIFSLGAKDLLEIPDQVVDTSLVWDFPVGLPPGDSTSGVYSFLLNVNTDNNEILDSLQIKQGDFQLNISTDFNHDAKINLTVPGLVKNGQPFNTVITLDYPGSLPHNTSRSFDLSGYRAQFIQSGQTNQLQANVEITGYGSNNPNNSPYNFDLTAAFENIELLSAFGYFSQYDFKLTTDSIAIELFKNDDLGSFKLEDPKINLRFMNSFGIPVEGKINEMKSYASPDEVIITQLSGAPLDDIMIDYPSLANIGGTKVTEVSYEKSNSNIDDAFDIDPHWAIYDLDGTTNPHGSTYNFLLDESSLGLEAEVEFPFYGRAWGFTMNDTIDFELSRDDLFKEGELQSLEMQVRMLNGFPVQSEVQVYFTDTNMVILDSLFDKSRETLMLSAHPGPAPEYKVSSPREKTTYVSKQGEAIDNILDAKKAVIRVKAYTADEGNSTVKIYSDYTVDVKIGVRAKFETAF
ncbi:MAG: hypothetical protein R6U19_04545 [Bacteroidales bacterium]